MPGRNSNPRISADLIWNWDKSNLKTKLNRYQYQYQFPRSTFPQTSSTKNSSGASNRDKREGTENCLFQILHEKIVIKFALFIHYMFHCPWTPNAFAICRRIEAFRPTSAILQGFTIKIKLLFVTWIHFTWKMYSHNRWWVAHFLLDSESRNQVEKTFLRIAITKHRVVMFEPFQEVHVEVWNIKTLKEFEIFNANSVSNLSDRNKATIMVLTQEFRLYEKPKSNALQRSAHSFWSDTLVTIEQYYLFYFHLILYWHIYYTFYRIFFNKNFLKENLGQGHVIPHLDIVVQHSILFRFFRYTIWFWISTC